MGFFEAIILGMVQGFTEFLPVSSSGHLVISQELLGMEEPGVTLEVLLHFGTLLSVFWVFGRDFLELFKFPRDLIQRRFLLLLILGVIPAGLAGFFLADFFTGLFKSTLVVGVMLLVTGGLLKLLTILPEGKKDISRMQARDALWIGLLQAFAIIPGISRSGSTITAALWRGLDRATAVRYSFMLSAPVILGATLVEVRDMLAVGIEHAMIHLYIIGGIVAFLSGVLAIRIFINLLKRQKFIYFAYYCWTVGAVVIAVSLYRMLQ